MKNILIVILAAVVIILASRWGKARKTEEAPASVRKTEVVTLEERHNKKVKGLHETAEAYVKAGEMKEAVRVWKEIVSSYPADLQTDEALYQLFAYHVKEGQMTKADTYEQELTKSFPQSRYIAYVLYEKGKVAEQNQDLATAQSFYRRVTKEFFDFEYMEDLQKRLETINFQLLFSKDIGEGTELYEVQRGDALYTIAKKFNTPVDFIVEVNNLKENGTIHPGQRLKVFKPDTTISLTVDKSQKTMIVVMNGEVLHRYFIAVGSENRTPVGKFAIQNKLKDPVWFNNGQQIQPDDPRNVLGTRWLGFDRDLGIHGTIEKKDILEQTSNGCVRMYTKEVEQLYKIVRVGDPLIIVE